MHEDQIATVVALHNTAHAAVEASFYAAIEALTKLDLGDASAPDGTSALAHWGRLMEALDGHHKAEETAFAEHLNDASEPPRGASARIYVPEHRQLLHLLAEGHAILVGLAAERDAPDIRARMVRSLEPLWRVIHLLSHHFVRERDIIYPWVLPRLEPSVREELRRELQKGLQGRGRRDA